MAQIVAVLRDDVKDDSINEYIKKWKEKGWNYVGVDYGFRQQKQHVFEAKGKRESVACSGTRGTFKSITFYYDM